MAVSSGPDTHPLKRVAREIDGGLVVRISEVMDAGGTQVRCLVNATGPRGNHQAGGLVAGRADRSGNRAALRGRHGRADDAGVIPKDRGNYPQSNCKAPQELVRALRDPTPQDDQVGREEPVDGMKVLIEVDRPCLPG